MERPAGPSTRAAWWVGAGILLSRASGFVRMAFFANYFGAGAVADVWSAAFRTPNVIQNLLGEGTLSASFIPVYAELLEQGREEEAGRFAGAVLGILTTTAFSVALLGIVLAPLFVGVLFPRWEIWQQDLGVQLVRIFLLMAAVLTVSAWALGVLNSHRKFFVSYVAPVAWNAVIVGALVVFGAKLVGEPESLAVVVAWGALAGGVLQLVVQLPWLAPSLRHLRISVDRKVVGVPEAIRNFLPVLAARGVVNLSGWLDIVLAGLLATGALAAVSYAQILYVLPISLFAMSIAASELPELSRQRGAALDALAPRVDAALRRITFLLVPSTLAYLVLGDVFVTALFRRGEFVAADVALVYAVLAAYSLGLVASSGSRVISSAFYSIRDTQTPARIAYLRVAISLAAGLSLMFPFDSLSVTGLGETRRFGAVGLALGASVGAWVEYAMLRHRLSTRISGQRPSATTTLRVGVAGLAAVGAGVSAKWALGSVIPFHAGWVDGALGSANWAAPLVLALGTALAFGVVYLAAASALGVGLPLRRSPRR